VAHFLRDIRSLALPALLLVSAPAFADASAKPIDVTAKVGAAVKDRKLSLLVGKETLGVSVDADPPKLRITYVFTNRIRTRTWADGQTVELTVPSPQPLIITHAYYGQFDDAVDVTPQVAAAVKDNAISAFTVNDDSMGIDPNTGVTKQLIVRYAIDGKQKMIAVDQNDDLKIPASPAGKKLEILEATYGIPVTYFDVTDIVANLLEGNYLHIAADDDLFGDPAPRQSGKQLKVEYMQDGQTHTVTIDQGKPLDIVPETSMPLIILHATYGALPK